VTPEDGYKSVREHLARALTWADAHVSFDEAVAGIEPALRGKRPSGLPYSAWQLVEHLRIAQHDILDFCRNPEYREPDWPADYWPSDPTPPSAEAWEASIGEYTRERESLLGLALDSSTRLDGRIPHGDGQTYLRELLLALDHAAYHVGELVLLRRLLGSWPRRTTAT
jgi:DinB family protein